MIWLIGMALASEYPRWGSFVLECLSCSNPEQIKKEDVRTVFRKFVFFQALARQDFRYLYDFFDRCEGMELRGYYWLSRYCDSASKLNCQDALLDVYLDRARDLFAQGQDTEGLECVSFLRKGKKLCLA